MPRCTFALWPIVHASDVTYAAVCVLQMDILNNAAPVSERGLQD